jgi:preprotein translocase subunit SecD
MRRRRGLVALVGIVALAALALGATLLVGNRPLLGLDLQGGVSVVLQPRGEVDSDALEEAKAIIEQRVNALGVAEPEITRQGDTVLVQIPGVKDKDRALELVGQTAELRFRPVLAVLPPSGAPEPVPVDPNTPTTSVPEDPSTTATPAPAEPGAPTSTVLVDPSAQTTAPIAPGPAPTGPGSAPAAPGGQETGMAPTGDGELALGAQDTSPPVTVTDAAPAEPGAPVPTDPGATVPGDPATLTPGDTTAPGPVPGGGATLPPDVCVTGVPADQDLPDQQVLLPQCDPETNELVAIYQLGPTLLSGDSLETARANVTPNGEWVVNPVFRAGAEGIDRFNAAASQCFSKSATCPTGQLAIVLDGRVVSAPSINEAAFQRDQIQISGSFTEGSARDLATVLKYGALPVEFEQQQAQIVSATLGRDALEAGLWAALVGFVAVTLYMVAFYRLLGVLAICKLAVEAALLWSVIAYLGVTANLALTLAGVTGLIVSIGVSVDSNVVYYEHLKEDVRAGRTIRSATDKAFATSFRTIVAADLASLIGAFLLWWLTVGPVRGFAFYLGLATILDLIASYFFMRPAVRMVTQSGFAQRHPRWLGLPAPPITPEAAAATRPAQTAAVGP